MGVVPPIILMNIYQLMSYYSLFFFFFFYSVLSIYSVLTLSSPFLCSGHGKPYWWVFASLSYSYWQDMLYVIPSTIFLCLQVTALLSLKRCTHDPTCLRNKSALEGNFNDSIVLIIYRRLRLSISTNSFVHLSQQLHGSQPFDRNTHTWGQKKKKKKVVLLIGDDKL